jgi:hypothetical protein
MRGVRDDVEQNASGVLSSTALTEIAVARPRTDRTLFSRVGGQNVYSGHAFPRPTTGRELSSPRLVADVRMPTRWVPPYSAVKRVFDMSIACILLVMLAPLCLAIAAAILLTMGGPVLFRQRRVGLHGQEISIWKFRSMLADRRSIMDHLPRSGTAASATSRAAIRA